MIYIINVYLWELFRCFKVHVCEVSLNKCLLMSRHLYSGTLRCYYVADFSLFLQILENTLALQKIKLAKTEQLLISLY